MSRFFSLTRLRALLAKETIQMRRDRITFALMLGVPLLQLVLFGFAINTDPKQLPAALVAPTQDRYTRAMVSALQHSLKTNVHVPSRYSLAIRLDPTFFEPALPPQPVRRRDRPMGRRGGKAQGPARGARSAAAAALGRTRVDGNA